MRLDGVGKRYGIGLPWVVRDVTMEIRPRGLVRLEGRNGTGKSTLLRVIAGISAPSRGTVTGRPVTGYVPERFPAALPFSARDYLGHIGRMHGMSAGQVAERIQVCLDRLAGWEFADVPLRNMSKGMCQKVAVAQALLPPSGLLVLDEAWTGLDVEARAALDEVVAERIGDGGSVVFVDHDPQRLDGLEAERWRIEDGQIRRVRAGAREGGARSAAQGPAGQGPAGEGPAGEGPAREGPAREGPVGQGEAASASRADGAAAGQVAVPDAGPPGDAAGSAASVGRAGKAAGSTASDDRAGETAAEGPGEGPVVESAAGSEDAARTGVSDPGPVVIEVAGYPARAADPGLLTGVRSARRDADRLTVLTDAAASDTVLRTLLGAGDHVHVLGVRPASRQPGAEQ